MGEETDAVFEWESEADALAEMYDDAAICEAARQDKCDEIAASKALYALADKAGVGQLINCPYCNAKFEKKSYQQKFCGNKGQHNCKDKYWNLVDTRRRHRAQFFN
ncbi:MAG: hypothetical protein WC907_08810 [Acholeplasmataceae bacterium]|jgi:hypothetical protein